MIYFPVGKTIVPIFQRTLGNDPHGLIFPVMVGLAQGPKVVVLCICVWRRGILDAMRFSGAWVKRKILWVKQFFFTKLLEKIS